MKYKIVLAPVSLIVAAILVTQLNAGGTVGKATGRPAATALVAGQSAGGGIAGIGADVVYTDIGGISNYGAIGGIRGYALGSHTCNIGTEDLLWTNRGTPGLAMNAYRLHGGRLIQLGQSWVKTACCAAATSGCGLSCNGHGGSVLGVGCRDVYSSGWNGSQGRLGPRSGINAYSGAFSPIPGGSGDAIFRRLQIVESDLSAINFPGALYFAEGVYVGSDDAQNANWFNNASYKRVTVGGGFNLSETGSMHRATPAIFSWRDHGNGPNNPDLSVKLVAVDVPNEGRFYAAAKVTHLDLLKYRYDYAVFNLNSHRSAGTFSVPLPSAAQITDIGFHDVDYHSGEAYDNADWSVSVTPSKVTWSSPATFAENPDTNALRWGTMYNFWIEVDVEPVEGEVTIGLFRPGTPEVVSTTVLVPGSAACPEDLDDNGDVGFGDILAILSAWGNKGGPEDLDGNGVVDFGDLLIVLSSWGPCP